MSRVVHFEIPCDDDERARAFYSKVFGWELMPMPDMGYTIVVTGPTDQEKGPSEPGFINGGLMKRDGDFTAPNVVLDVENLEESLKAVAAAGGRTVQERMAVGEMGFCAYFKDPEGNLIGLWENKPG